MIRYRVAADVVVSYDGVLYGPGEDLTAPADAVREWEAEGFVAEVRVRRSET